MLNLPKSGIIIAPANMHLQIFQEYKESINVEVYALSTFLSRFLPKGKEDLEYLYEYKNALKDIPSSNAFYNSCKDANFLKACLNFLKDMKMYNLHSFPCTSQKEKDLNEILSILEPVLLPEDSIPSIVLPDCSNVYILQRFWSVKESFWIQKLLSKGAHWIENDSTVEKYYYACSNTRKEMEWIAEEIIRKDYLASDCFIAVSNNSEKQVCAQILDAHSIPYTFLSNDSLSNVANLWICALTWVEKKDLTSFKSLVEQMYTYDLYVKDYFSYFPEEFEKRTYHCHSIAYQENNLFSEQDWKYYLSLETKTMDWMKKHSYLFEWNAFSLDLIAQEIQSIVKKPTIEDISLFGNIENLCQQAYPYIQKVEDLNILAQSISSSRLSTSSRKGICIGTKEDINPLYPITFLAGANANQFPKFAQYNGVFDEAYVSHTELPSLQNRLDIQKEMLFNALEQPQILYCLITQSDYVGKSLETSIEMNQWMNKKPIFQNTDEISIYTEPKFTLSKDLSNQLFIKDNQFRGSISRLEKMAKCPLSHFLNYGLHLQEVKEWKDVSIRGTILHSILEKATKEKGKEYANLTKEEIFEIVKEEFTFAHIAFPSKERWLQAQELEISEKISLIFEQLSIFEKEWKMKTVAQEQKFNKEVPYKDIVINLYGIIDRIDASSSSFMIFDYKSSDKDLSPEDFYTGVSLQLPTYALAYQEQSQKIPFGHYYIPLKTTPENHAAYKLAQTKKRKIDPIETETVVQKFLDKPLNGWKYQDVTIYDENKKRFKEKKGFPTFETMKIKWGEIIESLMNQILSGNIQPNHTADACIYCKYARICRNAKEEIQPQSRIKKGEEKNEV